MNIQLLIPIVNAIGPIVPVSMTDGGKAQVALTLMLSDGTVFSSTGGVTTPPETSLPPGTYECALVVSAFNHGAFGNGYDSLVDVAGQRVAKAKGKVPKSGHDSAVTAFQLVVA